MPLKSTRIVCLLHPVVEPGVEKKPVHVRGIFIFKLIDFPKNMLEKPKFIAFWSPVGPQQSRTDQTLVPAWMLAHAAPKQFFYPTFQFHFQWLQASRECRLMMLSQQ